MLQDASEKEGWRDIVSWAPDGLSFHVHDIDRFMSDVLPAYFNQTKFKSFQRQLNFYGFDRIVNYGTRGLETYSHRYLIRGNQEMCRKIIRIVGQDKPARKNSSSTSLSPHMSPSSPAMALTTHQNLDMQLLPEFFILSDEELSTQNDSQSSLASSYFVNPASKPSDKLSTPLNFDDTPISLEDPVSFGDTQFDLLSGLDEIISI